MAHDAGLDPLRGRIVDAWYAARDQDGDFGVPVEAFTERVESVLRERVALGGAPEEVLERLALRDVHLVMGCLARSDRAMRCFIERYGAHIDGVARRFTPDRAMAQDVRADLMATLFLPRRGEEISTARLYRYRGDCGLYGFLRVVVRRMAMDHLRRLRPTDGDDRLDSVVDRADDGAERRLEMRQCSRQLLPILLEAMDELADADRHLMRRSHRDGLVLREIADEDGVDISTVHRRLGRAQKEVWKRFHQRALAQLGLDTRDLQALLTALAEDLDLGALFTLVFIFLVDLARVAGGSP